MTTTGASERRRMDNEYRIMLTDSPDPTDVQVVREGLDAYDAAHGAPKEAI